MAGGDAIGLAVDLSTGGMARVALIRADGGFDDAAILTYSDIGTPTLTDAFLDVEKRIGHALPKAVAIAIPGVPGRSVIPVMRTRWTLSRSGLDQFFGAPVTIVNDGSALAWAATAGGTVTPVGDTAALTAMPALGRRVLVQYEAGVGASLIDSDADGQLRVLQTEMGHIGFAPSEAPDEEIVRELRAARLPASWEQVLRLGQGSSGKALSGLTSGQRQALFTRWAADFVGSAVLATCAWDGVYLSGSGWALLKEPALAQLFLRRLRHSRIFPRQFDALPCWHVEQQDAVLHGCAQILRTAATRG